MTAPDPDLDRLTSLLGQCLGRIDEQAFRIQQLGEEAGFGAADDLEDETAQLQELVASLLARNDASVETDINQCAEATSSRCIAEVGIPIVLRLDLASELPSVPYPPALVNVALQRAMMLATDHVEPGGELLVTTRIQNQNVLVEIEGRGCEPFEGFHDRTVTLSDFVQSFGGTCQTDSDHLDNVLVVLELPQVPVTDHSETL